MVEERHPEAGLELAWSLWTELGVPGPRRSHRRTVVDPERSVVVTPWFARNDPRLSDLVFSWCTQHAHRLSSSRLSSLLERAPPEVRSAADAFLGELATSGVLLARVRPQPAARPRDQRPIEVTLERAALLRLRMRALVGVSGRAEVLVALLAAPELWARASSLVDEVGLAKRNVAQVLSELAEGGIAQTRQRGNVHEFRLANAAALGEVVALSRDAVFPDWGAIFEWMRLADELALLPTGRPASLRVEVARRREPLVALAAGLALSAPETADSDDTARFLAWVAAHSRAIADGTSSAVGGSAEGRRHRAAGA